MQAPVRRTGPVASVTPFARSVFKPMTAVDWSQVLRSDIASATVRALIGSVRLGSRTLTHRCHPQSDPLVFYLQLI